MSGGESAGMDCEIGGGSLWIFLLFPFRPFNYSRGFRRIDFMVRYFILSLGNGDPSQLDNIDNMILT